MIQIKILGHTEMQVFGYLWLSKNSRHIKWNRLKPRPVSRKISLLPAKN